MPPDFQKLDVAAAFFAFLASSVMLTVGLFIAGVLNGLMWWMILAIIAAAVIANGALRVWSLQRARNTLAFAALDMATESFADYLAFDVIDHDRDESRIAVGKHGSFAQLNIRLDSDHRSLYFELIYPDPPFALQPLNDPPDAPPWEVVRVSEIALQGLCRGPRTIDTPLDVWFPKAIRKDLAEYIRVWGGLMPGKPAQVRIELSPSTGKRISNTSYHLARIVREWEEIRQLSPGPRLRRWLTRESDFAHKVAVMREWDPTSPIIREALAWWAEEGSDYTAAHAAATFDNKRASLLVALLERNAPQDITERGIESAMEKREQLRRTQASQLWDEAFRGLLALEPEHAARWITSRDEGQELSLAPAHVTIPRESVTPLAESLEKWTPALHDIAPLITWLVPSGIVAPQQVNRWLEIAGRQGDVRTGVGLLYASRCKDLPDALRTQLYYEGTRIEREARENARNAAGSLAVVNIEAEAGLTVVSE